MATRPVKDVPISLPHPALAGADWADAYEVLVDEPFKTARDAGNAIVTAFPRWTYPMLALRQILVKPFALKGAEDVNPGTDTIGIFPVLNETDREIVAGLDDKHLDFRIVVSIDDHADGQAVKLATVIKRHNALGRSYLMAVLPFHRAIIRVALAEI